MRGQFSVQLTWIFALIAGIAVLSFLIMFSRSQSESSELTSSITTLEHIGTELTAISKTPNTFNRIRTPKIGLNVMCDEPAVSGLRLEGGETIHYTRYTPIFAPKLIEGRELLAWTQDWALPENIERFVYLAGAKTHFILIKKEDADLDYQWLNSSMPEEFSKEVIIQGRSHRPGFDEYIFVFFGAPAFQVSGHFGSNLVRNGLEGKRYKVVNLVGSKAQYSDPLNPGGSTSQIVETMGTPALQVGAVFAEPTEYLCNLDKALFRLDLVTRLNENRTLTIMEELTGGNDVCRFYIHGRPPNPDYGECTECLSLMRELPRTYERMTGFLDNVDPDDEHDLEQISNAAQKIADIEKDLAKGSCPTV